jgi:hypothetical protein
MVQEMWETKKFNFLLKLKSLLNPGGQILLDSSDIIYMFDDDDGGNGFHPIMNIMEVVLTLPIKAKRTPFNWMYIDYNTLQNAAFANGLQAELILEGEHYDFLASCQFKTRKKD